MKSNLASLLRRASLLLDRPEPLVVVPYRGFANARRFFLKGRVLEQQGIYEGESNSRLRNVADNLRRLETDEVPGARVALKLDGHEHRTTTDGEGYFTFDLHWPAQPGTEPGHWLPASVQLLHSPKPGPLPVQPSATELLVPSANARFGIISDVDDTVLQTHVTSPLKLRTLLETLLHDSHQRRPMEGMTELLPALADCGQNPTFYVSDSPWNIYDLLAEFMRLHHLPKGPLLLRDYDWDLSIARRKPTPHKLIAFRQIMDMYPGLPFVMLGDTASKDADYYLQMAEEYPGRVLAIYIRQTRLTANARRVAQLMAARPDIAVMVRAAAEIWEDARGRGLVAA